MSQLPLRTVRLIGRPDSYYERYVGQAGEIYYDNTNQTLRIYPGNIREGKLLADRTWVNGQIAAVVIPSDVSDLSDSQGVVITNGGLTTLKQTTEVLNTKTSATGTVTHDFSTGAIWYHSSISANFTANFTNVPTTNDRSIVLTLILNQGATAYVPNAVQIAGVAQTINWIGATGTPSGNDYQTDIVSFTLIRTASAWTVLGSLTTFGE